MSRNEQIETMRIKILGIDKREDTSNDKLFNICLDDALAIALNRLYPFDKEKTTLTNTRHMNWQIRCAIEIYNKLGNEGLKSYSENGLSYTYLEGVVSNELLSELVPVAGIPK